MKLVPLLAACALVLAPAAEAKLRMSLAVGDRTPAVGLPFTVTLRAERSLPYDLKLIAVAPRMSWFDVVGRVTGASSSARADIPHDGFAIPVVRLAGNRWRATVTLPRRGRWLLVIPNGAPVGFMIPPPVIEPVTVG